MNDFSRYYAILRVAHDTDWKGLRAHYKRLIGQWHPDRFPADTSGRALAEERTKEITLAYQTLERYYRDHGTLPPMEPAPVAANAGTATGDAVAPANASRAAGVSAPRRSFATRSPVKHPRALIALSALIAVTYAAYRQFGDEAPGSDAAVANARFPETPRQQEAPRETGGISAGSTVGEVYAIQGIPTLTQGDTWHYGKSSISFAQGKVVSWVQHPENPLRIARDQPVELRDGVFDIGSTKDEVRSVQGTPVTETETVWDYGPSRVYFENNRVVRWEASPLQPLRVAR